MTVSRKNSKTVMAALVHIIAFYLDEENALHYLASNTKEQANNIFKELSAIITSSPEALKHFKIKKGYIEFLPKTGELKSLSGDSRRQDGPMVFVACVDECGADNNIADMIGSLEGGQYGPRSPLIVKISTSYGIKNAYNYWQDTVKNMTKNTFNFGNEHWIGHQFGLNYSIDNPKDEIEVDGKMVERWTIQSNWLESNPLIAEVPSLWEKLQDDYKSTKDSERDFFRFKVKNLNLWLSEIDVVYRKFVKLETLQQYEMKELSDWEWWRGKQDVIIGADMAMATDNTAIVFLWRDTETGINYVKNLVFYPKALEAYKIQSEKLPYDKWSKPPYDYCMPFGDEGVDWEGLAPWIHSNIIKKYELDIGTLFYDRRYAREFVAYFDEHVEMTVPATDFDQRSAYISPSISAWQNEILQDKVRYAPNGLFESATTNGRLYNNGGKPHIKKPENERDGAKVDSLFACFNAYQGVLYFIDNNLYSDDFSYVSPLGG